MATTKLNLAVRHIKGVLSSYNANEHRNDIFFATDANVIIAGGKRYDIPNGLTAEQISNLDVLKSALSEKRWGSVTGLSMQRMGNLSRLKVSATDNKEFSVSIPVHGAGEASLVGATILEALETLMSTWPQQLERMQADIEALKSSQVYWYQA